VLRFRTYGAQLGEVSRTYVATVLEDVHMRDWLDAARAERWIIETSELGRH
jgi:hypothetical protein